MKKIVFLFCLVSFSLTINAQRFTLNKHLIEDSLYLNDYTEEGIDLVNKTNNKMVIKYRTYINTIDTTNWTILYCDYQQCKNVIAYEQLCDTMFDGKDQKVRISNLQIQPGNTPKDCELCVEFFDVLDSTFRDTACYRYWARMANGPAGLSAYAQEIKTKVFPNPASSVVSIESSDNLESIELIDLRGKVIYRADNIGIKSETVNLEAIKTGTYFLHIKSEKGNLQIEKLVVK